MIATTCVSKGFWSNCDGVGNVMSVEPMRTCQLRGTILGHEKEARPPENKLRATASRVPRFGALGARNGGEDKRKMGRVPSANDGPQSAE